MDGPTTGNDLIGPSVLNAVRKSGKEQGLRVVDVASMLHDVSEVSLEGGTHASTIKDKAKG
jgi:hypothetical protein